MKKLIEERLERLERIKEALKNGHERIDCSDMCLDDEAVSGLMETIIESQNVKSINFSHNLLTNQSVEPLQMIANEKEIEINTSGNVFSEHSARL